MWCDLSQLAIATIWRLDTLLSALLTASVRPATLRSPRLIPRHQPAVRDRSDVESAVRRMSLARTIGRIAFVDRRRINTTGAQIRCSRRAVVDASTPAAS